MSLLRLATLYLCTVLVVASAVAMVSSEGITMRRLQMGNERTDFRVRFIEKVFMGC